MYLTCITSCTTIWFMTVFHNECEEFVCALPFTYQSRSELLVRSWATYQLLRNRNVINSRGMRLIAVSVMVKETRSRRGISLKRDWCNGTMEISRFDGEIERSIFEYKFVWMLWNLQWLECHKWQKDIGDVFFFIKKYKNATFNS